MSASTRRKRSDRPALAIVAIILSVFALSAGDAVIKLSSSRFPIWQIYIVRSALIIPVLMVLLWPQRRSIALSSLIEPWVMIRSVLLVMMWVAYYTALPEVDLSFAAAGYYTAPLMITLLSARMAGERVGGLVRAAVVLGFVGVLVILRPTSTQLTVFVALPFVAACLYAAAMLVTRARCSENNPLILAMALNIAFVVIAAVAAVFRITLDIPEDLMSANPFLFGVWKSMGFQEMAVIAALAIAMLVGSIGAAVAYQSGPAPVVAAFDYAYLVFAVLWGLIVFTEKPDFITLVGMFMIVVGGVLAVIGEG